jgi:hypothetical protein
VVSALTYAIGRGHAVPNEIGPRAVPLALKCPVPFQ